MERELLSVIREMLKEELGPLKTEITDIKIEMTGMKTEMTGMKNRMDETYEIVRALEHLSQVNKAEHDNVKNDIAYIKGDIETIKKGMYRVEEATANNWAEIARLKQAK
ncbi:hypothetical protein [Brassicibacter mesophilus]|uniref:hypothetical protein n=1 Tax=Brassicibacter mesophilus TaxID=745119 RepID=UPI003D262A74